MEERFDKTSHWELPEYFRNFEAVSFAKSLMMPDFTHAVHVMIYSPCSESVLNNYSSKAAVLMQMRFDGQLGFAGGLVDETLDTFASSNLSDVNKAIKVVTEALSRELEEEMNIFNSPLSEANYMFSHVNEKAAMCLHFFKLQMTLKQIREVEKNISRSSEFGQELMGIFRVPLYTMKDGYKGFPAFLGNNFIDAAKLQLIEGLRTLGILSETEIQTALIASKKPPFSYESLFEDESRLDFTTVKKDPSVSLSNRDNNNDCAAEISSDNSQPTRTKHPLSPKSPK